MKFSFSIATALLATGLASGVVQAQDTGSWGFIGGYSSGTDSSASSSADVDLAGTMAQFTISGSSSDTSGFMVGAVYDHWLNENWALGGQLSYHKTSFDIDGQIAASANGNTDVISAVGEGDTHTSALLLNLWRYSGSSDDNVRFFWGGGFGFATSKATGEIRGAGNILGVDIDNTTGLDEDGNGLAWQVGAGFDFDLSESSRGSISYRYFTAGEIEQIDTATHSIVFGIHF